MLPPHLNYLAPALHIVSHDRLVDARVLHRFISREITEKQLQTLSHVYQEIQKRNDVNEIARWYYDIPLLERWKLGADHVYQLFVVFQLLGERGICPFDSKVVVWRAPTRAPDWNRLPGRLRFLSDPAATYGIHRTDLDVQDFIGDLSVEDRLVLEQVAEQLRISAVQRELSEWLKGNPITEHEEAALVYFLIGLLDAANIFPP